LSRSDPEHVQLSHANRGIATTLDVYSESNRKETQMPDQDPCHPNLTEAEEENYDIDPSKIKEEKEECASSQRKQKNKQAKDS
jgi:hypothetical protein